MLNSLHRLSCFNGEFAFMGQVPIFGWVFRVTRALHRAGAVIAPAVRWLQVGLIVALSVCLTGCVDAHTRIHYDSPNRGEVVQVLRIGEQLQRFNSDRVAAWVKTIERRTVSLGGKVQSTLPETLTITLPFNNSTDLETKFNRLLAVVLRPEQPTANAEFPELRSHLTVTQQNFLLLERHHLRYEIDLRSLGVSSATGDLLVSPAALMDLTFTLETPWGARTIQSGSLDTPFSPTVEGDRRHLTWHLIPGEANTLESIFWLPSPLGIGTLVILVLVIGGTVLKKPPTPAASRSNPVLPNV